MAAVIPLKDAQHAPSEAATNGRDALFIRRVVVGFGVSLAMMCLLSFGSYVVMGTNIRDEAKSAELVSASATQRMRSQRLALLSLSLLSTHTESLQQRIRSEMSSLHEAMEETHRFLTADDSGRSTPLSPKVREIYFEPPHDLNKKVGEFLVETRRLIDSPISDYEPSNIHFLTIAALSTELLRDYEVLTDQYRSEGEAGVYGLLAIERAVLVVALLTALSMGVFIFRPMISRLRTELHERTARERRLREMTEKLKEHSDALSRSNAELEQFAGTVAHDLRAPLQNIRGFGALLKQRIQSQPDPNAQEFLGYINRAVGRMDRMIGDLLTFSRLTGQRMAPVALSLPELVKEISEDLATQLTEARAQLETSDLPTIYADPTQMRQVFQNVMQNAIKFKHPGRDLIVKVGCDMIVNGRGECLHRIVVSDNGIGFEAESSEEIFKVFHRLHQEGEYEGAGLGLAITRKIIRRLGGEVTAEGAVNEGARIIITLPVSVLPKQQPLEQAA